MTTAKWEKIREDRYVRSDGRFWAQDLGNCWVLWQAQDEPPAVKRSGRIVCFRPTLRGCKTAAQA